MELPMYPPVTETVPALLLRNLRRELILSIEEALMAGAQRAYDTSRGMDDGHLPHVVGQLRHFHMNESFHRALDVGNASPSPIRGNGIVIGKVGVFNLARFNTSNALWANGSRSQTRRQMSMVNKAIEPLVQPELFADYEPPTDAVVFFVACFSRSLRVQPEAPDSIQIAVPDRHMKGWLFKEPVERFVRRYDQITVQDDLAKPRLKKNIGKQDKDGTSS
jgi:hypothetical protein